VGFAGSGDSNAWSWSRGNSTRVRQTSYGSQPLVGGSAGRAGSAFGFGGPAGGRTHLTGKPAIRAAFGVLMFSVLCSWRRLVLMRLVLMRSNGQYAPLR
jgi:hypothetical protein